MTKSAAINTTSLASAKKFENHAHMVALYTVWYNFARQHKAHRLSPAIKFGGPAALARLIGKGQSTVAI